MCWQVSLAASYWLSTLMCFSSLISELPPMAITAILFDMGFFSELRLINGQLAMRFPVR